MSGAGWRWPAVGAGGASSGTPVIAATLQPTLYSPYAQWAMDPTNPSAYATDRSGNGRDLTVTLSTIRHAPAQKRPAPAQCNAFAGLDIGQTYVDGSALGYTGDLTITGVMTRGRAGAAQGESWVISNVASGIANQCMLGFTNADKFLYVADPSGAAVSTMDAPAVGVPTFVSVRRPALGSVTWGKNQSYETAAIDPPSIVPTGAAFMIGGINFGGGTAFWACGLYEDVCVWHSVLTDAQLVPLYKAAMGVA